MLWAGNADQMCSRSIAWRARFCLVVANLCKEWLANSLRVIQERVTEPEKEDDAFTELSVFLQKKWHVYSISGLKPVKGFSPLGVWGDMLFGNPCSAMSDNSKRKFILTV